ncbi:unnamed protein product [Prunus armeniaca]|uniref:Uncharacterized protein n=1 Tax=Prunus armeniaca TaxID=36596 RepID=A0A6J5YBA1_PRUAR|nr:unnamed protein product [Prunus armeniaca]
MSITKRRTFPLFFFKWVAVEKVKTEEGIVLEMGFRASRVFQLKLYVTVTEEAAMGEKLQALTSKQTAWQ